METIKEEPSVTTILSALIRGLDPFTGQRLTDAAMHRGEVTRALLEGREAMGKMTARAWRRAQLPPRVGEPWTADEDEKLVRGFKAGATIEELAREHQRSPRAIQLRLDTLGEATGLTEGEKARIFGSRPAKTTGATTRSGTSKRTSRRSRAT
jgi:hypothetical protein